VAASEPNNGAQAAAAQNEHWGVAASANRRLRLGFGMVLLNFELKLQGTAVLWQCIVSKSLRMLMLKMCMREWTMLMKGLWRENCKKQRCSDNASASHWGC
jgi:hypothetical protein